MKSLLSKTCDYCGDTIREYGMVKIRENGKVRFIFDVGCAILIGTKDVIKVKGEKYNLISI
jgi:ribosomal protein L24E